MIEGIGETIKVEVKEQKCEFLPSIISNLAAPLIGRVLG